MLQTNFKEVSRVFQGSVKGILRKFQGSSKDVLRTFQESFKDVSRKFQGCFKKAIRVFSRKAQKSRFPKNTQIPKISVENVYKGIVKKLSVQCLSTYMKMKRFPNKATTKYATNREKSHHVCSRWAPKPHLAPPWRAQGYMG